jgi:nitrate/TMAO reductase-like tetraheme cytochrome c subunit
MSEPTINPSRPWWMKVLGLRRRAGKFLRIAPTRWGYVLLIVFILTAGSAGFAEYSMQPDFCRSCHIMEPYYQAWHSSTHKNVPCTDCHFEPGLKNTFKGKWEASSQAAKFITGTYGSKPHAQINDISCMRSGCHEKRILEGKVDWTVTTPKGNTVTIKFDHKPHLEEERRGKQLRCVSCHSQIVQGQHLVVTLDTCFLCHMKGKEHGRNEQTVGGCTSCHEAPKAKVKLATGDFDHADYLGRGVTCNNCHSEAIKGDGNVPRQVCWNCHNQPAQVAQYGETAKMHKAHISEHKTECSSCHVQIEHGLNPTGSSIASSAAGASGASAGAKTASHGMFETGTCGTCHQATHGGPAELYRGTGGRGVPDMPSPMSRAQVDCIACHKAKDNNDSVATVVGQTFKATQESCNYCHGTKYEGSLDAWRKQIDTHLKRAEEVYARALAASDGSLRIRRLLDDADHNIRLVKLGHGVHNVAYATALLNAAIEWCDQANPVTKTASAVPAAGGP